MCTVSILLFVFDKGIMLRTKILHCTAVPNNRHPWNVFSVGWNLSLHGCQSTVSIVFCHYQLLEKVLSLFHMKSKDLHFVVRYLKLLILFDSMTNDKKFYKLTNPHSINIHFMIKRSHFKRQLFIFSADTYFSFLLVIPRD